jgi:soluble lytic murein transglycosylase-like protein
VLEQFQSEISAAARTWSVPEWWIKGVIMAESSGDPNAYRYEAARHEASYGLMQLLESTARGLGFSGDVDALYTPGVNIDLGTKLLSQLRARFGDDLRAVYSAYNSGSGTAYTTNPTVAANVQRVIGFVEQFIRDEPAVASTGAVGALIVLLLIWYWTKRKGR